MILSTSIDTLKILLNIRRKFISLHRNDDIVYLRSFQIFGTNNVR